MNDQLQSQEEAILARLRKGPLTPLEALEDQNILSFRLGARIHSLRQQGWPIQTETVKQGKKRFARYHLLGPRTYAEVCEQIRQEQLARYIAAMSG